ncbi:MAG: hypothetical protein FJ004_04125 [Chloroflexi bacterium]|nr:hypothetical protein [Chloroflexota bacterium]
MILSDMRTLVRRDLHDEDASNYRWTNDVIDRHIAHAVKEFSQALPVEDTTLIATTSGSRDISVAALTTRVMIEAVEYKTGNFPPSYQRFSEWKDTLTIQSDEVPDGSNAKVYYGKLHTLDGSGSTIPTQYEDLVANGAAGFALIEWAAYAVNRVNVGGEATARTYRLEGEARLKLFRSELKKLGRQGRVRVRQLYTPYQAPVSKSIVMGP